MNKDQFNTTLHSGLLQLVRGLQALPLIGGFIPDYKGGQVSAKEVRSMLNKAYAHIDELSAKEKAKLNSIINQANELGVIAGSPALMSFVSKQKSELNKQYDKTEKRIDDLNRSRELMRDTGDDFLNADDSDKIRGSNLHRSLEQAYEQSMNIKGDENNV